MSVIYISGMAKKKKQNKETTIENYYDLKTEEMDELVAALKGDKQEEDFTPIITNIAEITGEEQTVKQGSKKAEFDPYRRDKLSALPVWLKAIVIKWWFAGLVCFLFVWGLQLNALDTIWICGLALGIVTDVFVNPIFHFLESDKKEYDKYMMFPFPFKKYWTFFANILYYSIIVIGVYGCYFGINHLINYIANTEYQTYLGVEALLFGVFCVIVDMAFIGVKDLIVFLVKRGKKDKEKEITDV